ncbi:hypothetical protein, partial [Hymenobacter lapidiphilus]|uniref:hypothetical protein n=1 Tax=Hymenobacter sp. CCM 8763 TaxID=2303334 RepID=UPI001A934467
WGLQFQRLPATFCFGGAFRPLPARLRRFGGKLAFDGCKLLGACSFNACPRPSVLGVHFDRCLLDYAVSEENWRSMAVSCLGP